MRVPTYENQVSQQPGSPLAVPNLPNPPEAAFGGGLAQQMENTGKVISGLGEKFGEHVIERKRQDQAFQTMQIKNQYLQGVQNTLFAQGSTQTEDGRTIPAGVMNREYADAKGATMDFDAQNQALQEQALSQVSNPIQQRQLQEQMDEHSLYHRQLVIHHEAEQNQKNKLAIFDATKTNLANMGEAFQNDPSGLNAHIQAGFKTIHAGMMDLGKSDPAEISKELDLFASNATANAIRDTIVENPYQAMKVFEATKDNMLEPTKLRMQKAIRSAIKQFEIKKKGMQEDQFNESEAKIGSLLANGQLNQLLLDQQRNTVSPEFYNLATNAIEKGTGDPDAVKPGTAISLMKEYAHIVSMDGAKRTNAMVKFRKDILANSTNLGPQTFQQLLGYTDPNFVKQALPQKVGSWQAALNWITDAYHKMGGGDPTTAMHTVTQAAMNPNVKAEDMPAVAQAAVKGDALRAHPSLVGQPDLANNVANVGGIRQVTNAASTLKPAMTIRAPKQFKAGDTATKNGVTYVRGEDGNWHPKP